MCGRAGRHQQAQLQCCTLSSQCPIPSSPAHTQPRYPLTPQHPQGSLRPSTSALSSVLKHEDPFSFQFVPPLVWVHLLLYVVLSAVYLNVGLVLPHWNPPEPIILLGIGYLLQLVLGRCCPAAAAWNYFSIFLLTWSLQCGNSHKK